MSEKMKRVLDWQGSFGRQVAQFILVIAAGFILILFAYGNSDYRTPTIKVAGLSGALFALFLVVILNGFCLAQLRTISMLLVAHFQSDVSSGGVCDGCSKNVQTRYRINSGQWLCSECRKELTG